MTKHSLIYERPMPLSKERHASWSVKQGDDYGFSRDVNAVPLTIVEFAIAAREYPIVFARSGEQYSASALLGLRSDENLFLDDAGKWLGSYVPAFLRRYPFVFSHDAESETYTLCIDEGSVLSGGEVDGERLYDDTGGESPYLKRMIGFTKSWQKAFQETQAFCRRLDELGLITDSEVSFNQPDGHRAKTSGFGSVDRERLKSLGAKALTRLMQSGDLELIYAHLLSHRSLDNLLHLLPDEEAQLLH
ncbi:SapC family protein [Tropicimonas aquimaris]|uniref:SapC family protein n=1 Tax=Tropicimonas aquimaris TaxID=914152 RepID=A0ABW3IUG2_9RHOB